MGERDGASSSRRYHKQERERGVLGRPLHTPGGASVAPPSHSGLQLPGTLPVGVACGPGRCRLGAFPGGGPSADKDRPVYRVGRGNGGFARVRRVRAGGVCGGYRRGSVRVVCGAARWERGVARHTFHRPPTLVGRRFARRSSELRPVGCAAHRGTLPACVHLPRVLPEGLPRTDPTAPPCRDLSAAPPVGWPSAFRRPVRLPACVSSPSASGPPI